MKVGLNQGKLVGLDETSGTWVAIGEPWADDLLGFLAGGTDAVQTASKLISAEDRVESAAPTGLPFTPQSLRAFALWESHMVNGARGMVNVFAPANIKRIANGYEKLTGKVFPPLKPKSNYYRDPQFYMSNHRSIMADGDTLRWPSFGKVVDFELEIGAVIARTVRDCSPAEGLAAIGGFVVMNDWSARDTQWDDTQRGTFGGIVKSKTFAGAMSAVVVTADEILPQWGNLTGRVLVNGEVWAQSSTANPLHDLGAAVAYAARGESLSAGDVLSSGTLPGCCGLEMRRFPKAGDEVRLEIDGIGSLTNTVDPAGRPSNALVSGNGKQPVTVVTGCDSGMGKDLALEFHRRGHTVYATGLNPDAMADLKNAGLLIARLDITDPDNVAAFTDQLAAENRYVDTLVNNAGFGAMGPVMEMPMADVRRQYEVNVFGLLGATHQLAQEMINARAGTIVNIGSTSGVLTSPFGGVYCSTKAAVHALNDAMRMELAPFGIKVIRVEPNQIRTSFGDTAAAGVERRITPQSRYFAVKDMIIGRAQGSQHEGSMPSAEFAAKVVDGVLSKNPPVRLRIGKEILVYTLLKPFVPSPTVDRLLSKRFQLERLK